MRILGIETSCDETAAAVVEDGERVLSNIVASQVDLHAPYGGVFPELASRMHMEAIGPVVAQALQAAHVGWTDLDALAVTYGPGLPGSLLVGLNFAKGAALSAGLPLVPVNHLEGHLYAHWLRRESAETPAETPRAPRAFPLLALIVSGGHTELILMRGHGQYDYLGGTLDDAAGEAFDKVARMLGLGYPGGPAIERAARQGNPHACDLPRAWLPGTYDFSFSGLKTAVMRALRQVPEPSPRVIGDIAAAFQASVVEVLAEKTAQAALACDAQGVLLSGGVSANATLRAAVRARVTTLPVHAPPLWLCTDNGAMIAAAGTYRYQAGARAAADLDIEPGLRLA